jgi:hypothetical protein
MARAEPWITPRIGARAEPMQTLGIQYLTVSWKATRVSMYSPQAKCMYFTRDIVTSTMFLMICIVQARLSTIIEMNKGSRPVLEAVAPPMPDTEKQE